MVTEPTENETASMTLEPIALEVLRGRLDAITTEMQDTLIRCSFSTIVTEGGDATGAIFDARGHTVAQACAIPVLLGTLHAVGRRFAQAFPAEIAQDGDLYIFNDPYDGGTHLPDIAVAAPVFVENRLIGYVCCMTHHQDIGGSIPGSWALDAFDHLAEGIRIPMTQLAHAGVRDTNVIGLLAANTRTPKNLLGDLDGQIASCHTGVLRLKELCARMGMDTYKIGVLALMDYAERITRAAIERVPDGKYEYADWLDDDNLSVDSGPVKIKTTITISGSDMVIDFTGTDPQVRSSINNVPSSTMSVVYFIIRALAGDTAPNNDGCFRPVTAILPPGTIVNARFPAPVAMRSSALIRIFDSVLGAMALAAPEQMYAAGSGHATVITGGGVDPVTGEPFVGTLGGPLRSGMGARATKDGLDVCDHGPSNAYHIPLEIAEARLPILYNRLELWTDSGGAGLWRGGLGFECDVKWMKGEGTFTLTFERMKYRPFGIEGGDAAPVCRCELLHADGNTEALYGKGEIRLNEGDCLRYWSTGGGGYGDPLSRPSKLVSQDVLDGRVSSGEAQRSYGVVLDGTNVVAAETSELRQRLHLTRSNQIDAQAASAGPTVGD
jgi:N-methylhydantoinase B/oxoprolinase/acetone carboxylase alpha subunit